MQVETKFLRLFKPAALGDRIDGWRVCWIGGWDKCRVLFVVMVEGQSQPARSDPPDALPRRKIDAAELHDIFRYRKQFSG